MVFVTNAFSSRFPQLRNKQFPIFTYIILSEPLSRDQLAAIGWAGRQGIEDARNMIHYYRLTPDNRILFGGADAQYYMGGPLDRDNNPSAFRRLERESEFTSLFFVNRRVIPVPPEPLRFVLGESIRRALKAQDAWEARKGTGVAESASGKSR